MLKKNNSFEDKIKSINATNKYEEMQVDWFPPCNSDEYYFVSYCHKDYKAVFKNLFELQNQGKNSISVWYDWKIHVGTSWEKEVEDHIHNFNCKGIIFYISNNFILSDAIFKEIQWVKDSRKQYIPIYIPNDTTEIFTAENLYKQEVSEAEWDNVRIQVLSEFFGEKINYLKIDDNIENIIYKIKNFDPLPLFNTKLRYILAPHLWIAVPEGILEISSIRNINISEIGLRDYPKDSRVIGPYCFANCQRLKKIIIPKEILFIAKDAFVGCIFLKEVYYEGTLKDWCNMRFESYESNPMSYASHFYLRNCKGGWEELKEITISLDYNSLSRDYNNLQYAFCNCQSLLSVTIKGDGVIGSNAFFGCGNLASVRIGNGVTRIGNDAFLNCYSLVEVYNLSNLNIEMGSENNGHVGKYAKVIHTSFEEESRLIGKDNYVFYKDNDNKYYLVSYKGIDTEVVLPNDIEENDYEIYQYAFDGCSSLRSIVIPNGVTSIGSYAFYNCSSLTSIAITNSVTSIEYTAFYGCESLKEVYYEGTIFEFMESCRPLTAIFPYLKHFYIRNCNGVWKEVPEKLLCKYRVKLVS